MKLAKELLLSILYAS